MKKNIKKGILLITLILIIYIMSKVMTSKMDIYKIKEYVNSFGILSPIIYIIMFALVPLTFFPDSILAIAGGLIFGLFKGFLFTSIGALIGGSIAFFISRYLGRDIIKKISKDKLHKIEKLIEKDGFYIIFLLRLIPLFPFDIISYGAGLTNVKYKHFLLATFIGTIPGIVVFSNIGAKSVNMASKGFYVSIAMLILLLITSIFLKNKILSKSINKLD
ncbi:TVP38/TMEM64 family protein [Romboutsia maritimum]|uniref:TVP38/TMEM64 family membrane protein n=2 Tax=Romboutsia maritimum TaxID=2020948 RepID=A0A371ISV6_9FIRM|nr:TVP38/TMEM64 family protein [Romboutsia maritimum]